MAMGMLVLSMEKPGMHLAGSECSQTSSEFLFVAKLSGYSFFLIRLSHIRHTECPLCFGLKRLVLLQIPPMWESRAAIAQADVLPVV